MNFSFQKTMFIDIETVSGVKHYSQLSEQMQKLWQKKSALIAKDNPDFEATYENNAGIYAEFGKIVCICLGYFTDKFLTQFRVKKIYGDNEHEVLVQTFDILGKFLHDNTYALAGHNIKEFDVPYLCRRALIHGLTMPNFLADLQNKKPWENPLVDTLHLWRFGDFKHYTSLELLATILGIPTPKDDIAGSDVGKVYWQHADLERIATYCGKDVVTSAQVLLKMQNQQLIADDAITIV